MKKQTDKEAAVAYAERNYTSGTWSYSDAKLAFLAGVRWERARRRREEKKAKDKK